MTVTLQGTIHLYGCHPGIPPGREVRLRTASSCGVQQGAGLGLGICAECLREQCLLPLNSPPSIPSSLAEAPRCSRTENMSSSIPPPLQVDAFSCFSFLPYPSPPPLVPSPPFCTQASGGHVLAGIAEWQFWVLLCLF